MKSISRMAIQVTAVGLLALASSVANAQADYPQKPIHLILGVSPGGLIDTSARLVASYLSPRIKQQIIVENRPGASTTIAANNVLKAAPDGYTLFYGGVMSASPIFVKNNPVDFVTQLKPVSLVLSAPFFLLLNSTVPARTMPELVAYSKAHPNKLNFADGAAAGTMVMYAVAERTGLTFTAIPYKGSSPSLNALVSGEVDLTLDTVPNYLQYIKLGKVRAVMNTGPARTTALADVPAAAEIGGMNFNAASVLSLWAPPGTPDVIVQKISTEIAALAKDPAFREKFRASTQVDPIGAGPVDLLKTIEADKALYGRVAKQIGYQPQ